MTAEIPAYPVTGAPAGGAAGPAADGPAGPAADGPAGPAADGPAEPAADGRAAGAATPFWRVGRNRTMAGLAATAVVLAALLAVLLLSGGNHAGTHTAISPGDSTTTAVGIGPAEVAPATSTSVAPTTTAKPVGTVPHPPATPVARVVSSPTTAPTPVASVSPAAPGDLVAYATSPSSGTATWAPPPPGGPAVASYRVTTVPATAASAVPANADTAALRDLAAGTVYTVEVVAVDAAGRASPPATTLLVNGASPAQSEVWAQLAGGALHTGQSVAAGPADGSHATTWTAPAVPATVVDSPPLVGPDGDVYVQTTNGIDIISPNGQPATNVLAGVSKSVMAVGPDGSLFAAYPTSSGPLAVASIGQDGSSHWQTTLPSPSGAAALGLVLADGVVYVHASSTDALSALDAATGAVLWTFNAPAGCGCLSDASLSPDGATVYLTAGHLVLYALAAGPHGGTVEWTRSVATGADSGAATPVVGGDGTVYIHWSSGTATTSRVGVSAFGPDGSPRWSVSDPSGNPYAMSLTATGLLVYGDDEGVVHALRAADGSPAWTYGTAQPAPADQIMGAPAVARDGTLYFQSAQAVFALSNAGKLLWSAPAAEGAGHPQYGSALALDGTGGLVGTFVDQSGNGKVVTFR